MLSRKKTYRIVIIVYTQCGNGINLLSKFSCKNYVKSKYGLLNSWSWFHEIFLSESKFLIFPQCVTWDRIIISSTQWPFSFRILKYYHAACNYMHFLELDSDLCVCYSLFLNILLQTRFVKTRLTSNRNASNLLKKTFLESRRIMFFKGLNEAYHCNGQPFVYLDTETKHFQRFLMIMIVRKYMYFFVTCKCNSESYLVLGIMYYHRVVNI